MIKFLVLRNVPHNRSSKDSQLRRPTKKKSAKLVGRFPKVAVFEELGFSSLSN